MPLRKSSQKAKQGSAKDTNPDERQGMGSRGLGKKNRGFEPDEWRKERGVKLVERHGHTGTAKREQA